MSGWYLRVGQHASGTKECDKVTMMVIFAPESLEGSLVARFVCLRLAGDFV